MKQRITILTVLLMLALLQNTFAQNNTTKKLTEQKNPLPGTWRLIYYSDFDSMTGKWIQPYGEHPRGYFTYTESGIVNLNVSSDPAFNISEDSTKNIFAHYQNF